uniref:Cytochrome P450 708A2 n=1 Tax=Noccaea caerulescens TaxID=107243 RepID=A0A1J3HXK7_NOCCA
MTEILQYVWPVIVSLFVVKLSMWIYRWSNPIGKEKLPPGSMGFPIIGETLEFSKPHGVIEISPFLTKRIRRYGPIFRTSLFGGKVIICADSEVTMEIGKGNAVFGIPESVTRLFGEDNLFSQSKESHKHVKHLTLQMLGSQALKVRMIQDIDLLARRHIEIGAMSGCLGIKETASKIIIHCISKKVMGDMDPEDAKELELCWGGFPGGWFGFSYNIPGTALYQLLKARKKMMTLIKKIIVKKRSAGEDFGEFFDIIFREMEREGETVSLDNAVQYIYTFFLLNLETTPRFLVGAVKLISDHPEVMQELQREHEAFVQNKTDKEAGLSWEDYKSMTFTQMVINEALRITSTFPTVLRKITDDVEVRGYTIPAGWTFLGFPFNHFNEEKYDDPFSFNPWRWKGKDLNATVSKSFLPFGVGTRLCPGAEFAKMQLTIFLHHLSRYRWSMNSDTKILRQYILLFPQGTNVQITGRY